MLNKTNGIVISYVKYSESSIICKIFTEQFGIQSFMINGIRSKSSKNKIALFQPLTLLEIVMYYKEGRNLQRISEVKCIQPFIEIPTVFSKSCTAIFITEILQKITIHQDSDATLFNFLIETIATLEHADKKSIPWVPIQFILGLSRVQGFLPLSFKEINVQFDTIFSGVVSKELEEGIHDLIVNNNIPDFTNTQRKELFQYLITYYRETIGGLSEIKSLQVLKEILQ